MNLKNAAKRLKRISLALVAVAIVGLVTGCNPINVLGQLMYLGNWATNALSSSTGG